MIKYALIAFSLAYVGCDKAESEPEEIAVVDAKVETEPQPAKVDTTLGDPSSPGTTAQLDMLAVAKGHFMENRPAEAQAAFEKLVKAGPLSAAKITGYIALGQLYKDKGETAKARTLYEELVKIAPEIPEGHFMLGRLLGEAGEATLAIRAYERTVKLQPDYLQAYVELGGLYVNAGRDDEAQKIFLMYEQRIYGLAKRLESKETPLEDRLAVLEVFSFIQDDRANQAIMVALKDGAPEVREQAVILAEEFGIGEALELIEAMSKDDSDLRVRVAARSAMERLRDAPVGKSPPPVAN